MEPLMQVVSIDRGIVRRKRARRVMQVSGRWCIARCIVGGALMERAWVLADAACASGASPRTCRGAVAFLCSSAEGRNRGGRAAECGCFCAAGEAGIVEVIHSVLVERIKDQIADQMVDIPVPPVMEDNVAVVKRVVKLVPRERVQQRIGEQMWRCLFHGNECSSGSASRLWRCLFHKSWRTLSKSSRIAPQEQF